MVLSLQTTLSRILTSTLTVTAIPRAWRGSLGRKDCTQPNTGQADSKAAAATNSTTSSPERIMAGRKFVATKSAREWFLPSSNPAPARLGRQPAPPSRLAALGRAHCSLLGCGQTLYRV